MSIEKTVILVQKSRFQTELWRFILEKYNITVICKDKHNSNKNITDYFKSLDSKPDLLIIDFTVDNDYGVCRSFHQHYPSSKIILTIDSEHECLSSIRFLAMKEEIDEILFNFQKENLSSTVATNINFVFQCLNYPCVQEETLFKIIESFVSKNFYASNKKNELKKASNFTQKLDKITGKPTLITTFLSFFVVILLATTLIINARTLSIISSLKLLQSEILASARNEEKSTKPIMITSKEVQKTPQGTFNYGGSTTWASIRKKTNSQISKTSPEFDLRYLSPINSTSGSGAGIRMLLEGELDFAQSSRPIKLAEHLLAHQLGFTLKEYHVAIDAIAIAVHPSLQVSGLTIEQLKKIYLGQITNWKEVDGPDLEIVPFSRREEEGGTPEFFRHYVMNDQSFGKNVKRVSSTTDGLRQVTDIPGGIYYGSAPQIVPQCKVKALPIANSREEFVAPYVLPGVAPETCPKKRNQMNIEVIKNATYPITRYLSVIVKEDGGRAQKVGEAYTRLILTKQMQQLIEEAGFVSIN